MLHLLINVSKEGVAMFILIKPNMRSFSLFDRSLWLIDTAQSRRSSESKRNRTFSRDSEELSSRWGFNVPSGLTKNKWKWETKFRKLNIAVDEFTIFTNINKSSKINVQQRITETINRRKAKEWVMTGEPSNIFFSNEGKKWKMKQM